MNIKELKIPTVLGMAFGGFGGAFALTPGLINRMGGQFLPDGPETNLLIRLVGMRDISLGLGMLASHDKPETVLFLRRVMAFNTGTDLLLLGLYLPRARTKFKVTLAMLTSTIIMALALKP